MRPCPCTWLVLTLQNYDPPLRDTVFVSKVSSTPSFMSSAVAGVATISMRVHEPPGRLPAYVCVLVWVFIPGKGKTLLPDCGHVPEIVKPLYVALEGLPILSSNLYPSMYLTQSSSMTNRSPPAAWTTT